MISIGFFHFLSAVVFTGFVFWIIWLLKEMSAAKRLARCFIQEKRFLSTNVARDLKMAVDLAGVATIVVDKQWKQSPMPIFPAAIGKLSGLPTHKIVLQGQRIGFVGTLREAEVVKDALRLFFSDKIQIDDIGENA